MPKAKTHQKDRRGGAKCTDPATARKYLTDYLLVTGLSRDEKRRFQKHLEDCRHCATGVSTFRTMVRWLRAHPRLVSCITHRLK